MATKHSVLVARRVAAGLFLLFASSCGGSGRLGAGNGRDAGQLPDVPGRAGADVDPAGVGGDTQLDAAGDDLGSDACPVDLGADAQAAGAGEDAQLADVGADASPSEVGFDIRPEESGVTVVARLPSPRHSAAVFSDGKVVYALGGCDDAGNALKEIVRFAPATGAVTVLPEILPLPIYGASIAWTGNAAYLLGGLSSGGADTRQILRYEPATGAVTQMKAKLPSGAFAMGAAWTGSTIYLLGGSSYEPTFHNLNQILSYDVAGDSLVTLPGVLPAAVDGPIAFWDGTSAWAIGGNSSGVPSVAVQRLDPGSGRATLAGTLDVGLWAPAAFYDGSHQFLVGGVKQLVPVQVGYRTILSFDPKTSKTTTLPLSLPFNVSGGVGAWVSSLSAGYLLGGVDYDAAKAIDTVIRIRPW